ncbi:MAG TPA: hypothetical protein VH062_37145 [Polyangiaceae bacterium]|nr:hypothetical protein [Polyangiaceae bacterium]
MIRLIGILTPLVVVIVIASCTTQETGSIDLATSAAMSAPMPPPMPPPKPPKPNPGCAVDTDCTEPARPRCDVASATCVQCLGDAGCAPGQRCQMDSMCHPMP